MGNYKHLDTTENPKLRQPLERKPRKLGGNYFYCPNVITKKDDLEEGARLEIVDISTHTKDRTITVRKKRRWGAQNSDNTRWEIFFTDLRR